MGRKTCEKLVAMFADETLKRLKVELAIVVDLGVHLVKVGVHSVTATYLLLLKAYEILQGVFHAIGQCHYPNLHRVCSNIAADKDEEAVLKGHAKAGVRDAVRYFLRKFNVEHVQVVRAFKAARLLSPAGINGMQPSQGAVQELHVFPFLDKDEVIGSLRRELPLYLAAAEDVHVDVDALQWWGSSRVDLHVWSSVFQNLLAIQPSSASAEREFSLLKAAFDTQQEHALQDYIEATVMLPYNQR